MNRADREALRRADGLMGADAAPVVEAADAPEPDEGFAEHVPPDVTEKPDLVVHGADLPATTAELRRVLAGASNLFDRGGVPVLLVRSSAALTAKPLTFNNVIVEAHRLCRPVRLDKDGAMKPVTLPAPVAKMFLDLGEWGFPPLTAIAGTPILRGDGSFSDTAGHDPISGVWCEAVPPLAVPDRPSREDATRALATLRRAFRTFPFADAKMVERGGVAEIDIAEPPGMAESSFLTALLTAVCRPSLRLAPGLLISAPDISGAGSGKGLLARAIGLVAFGRHISALTAGHDRQELDKRLTAALIEASPMLFLDNVNATALRSDTLASVLTERPAHVRPMGSSVMVPLNAAAFISVTGNGLSVTEDLARRFLVSDLDPRCEDPEARPFPPGFLTGIEAARAELLTACLTIWRWGRQSQAIAPGLPLGSYEEWCIWVRDPLLALGCADPVARIKAAKMNDPKRRMIAELFAAWWEHHQDRPVTAAMLNESVLAILNPQGRPRQYVAQRLLQMTGTRSSGFVLTRQAPAGTWTAATYALKQAATDFQVGTGIGHRTHRAQTREAKQNQGDTPAYAPPMPPDAPPMPSDASGGTGREETKKNQGSNHTADPMNPVGPMPMPSSGTNGATMRRGVI